MKSEPPCVEPKGPKDHRGLTKYPASDALELMQKTKWEIHQDTVKADSVVTVRYLEYGSNDCEWEISKIADSSLGRALIGQKKYSTVTVCSTNGDFDVQILEIRQAATA